MLESLTVIDGVTLRQLFTSDAPALAAAYRENQDHLRQWEPARPPEFLTDSAQADILAAAERASAAGSACTLGLWDGDALIGRFVVGGITRGVFQNASLGYWVDSRCTGRGLATAAVQRIIRAAHDELGLHRLEASTLRHNTASQRVLVKSGFTRIGMAPQYLCIAGEWQDHDLFQIILESRGAPGLR